MNTPVTRTYIGIDPGYAICGYGIISKTGSTLKCIDYGAITTKAGVEFPNRLLTISDAIRGILEIHKPDCMAIEELFMGANHTTVIGTAQARGVIIAEAARAGLPVFEFTPGQIKLSVTGYGKADKNQVTMMVRSLLKLKEAPKPDDVTDALAVAITLAHTGEVFADKAVSGYQYGRYGYSRRNVFG